ncbi:hypothetical protein BWI93_24990 [Siphonobacter sp. BAB-5385]|uniref:hypothetical protein n=1 Tax=Siphonobacter sp. BAB-5385 TaxID=1864822 RepID=UPI000B9EAE38|nr:hypothetical protein [Siphonobacter sp. BAB-5385]OZI05524.1 hypothetical protein BWI93_24990 [Siphonobacter sp. BAB-5385]
MTLHCIDRIRAIKAELATVHGQEHIHEMIGDPPDHGDELDHLIRDIVVFAYEAGRSAEIRKVSESGWRKRADLADRQAKQLEPVIKAIIRSGKEFNPEIADELNWRGIKTRGGNEWAVSSVRKLRLRIEKLNNDKNSPSRE